MWQIRREKQNSPHKYLFRWRDGDEADLIKAFSDLASSSDFDFDWLDAAELSYQVGRRFQEAKP